MSDQRLARHSWPLVVATAILTGACSSPTSPSATAPPVASSPAPSLPPTSVPTGSATTVLRRAEFQGANGYRTEGSATIQVTGSSHTLELGENFRAGGGGIILDVRLCREARCVPSDLTLGTLQNQNGRQSFAMPDGGDSFRFVVIWCRPVSLAFGAGELR